MLSVIELVQFKSLLRSYGQGTDSPVSSPSDDRNGEQIVFFNRMPTSSIVHDDTVEVKEIALVKSASAGENDQAPYGNDQKELRLRRVASSLHEKYIRRHCELEVNISGTLRDQWGALHSRDYPVDEVSELIQVVNQVVSEMMKYVRQSFLRYDIDRQ